MSDSALPRVGIHVSCRLDGTLVFFSLIRVGVDTYPLVSTTPLIFGTNRIAGFLVQQAVHGTISAT